MDYEAIIDVLISGGYIVEGDRERAALRLRERSTEPKAEASGELETLRRDSADLREINIALDEDGNYCKFDQIKAAVNQIARRFARHVSIIQAEPWREPIIGETSKLWAIGLLSDMFKEMEVRPAPTAEKGLREALIQAREKIQEHVNEIYSGGGIEYLGIGSTLDKIDRALLAHEAPKDNE